jgi:hypothetical protein
VASESHRPWDGEILVIPLVVPLGRLRQQRAGGSLAIGDASVEVRETDRVSILVEDDPRLIDQPSRPAAEIDDPLCRVDPERETPPERTLSDVDDVGIKFATPPVAQIFPPLAK